MMRTFAVFGLAFALGLVAGALFARVVWEG
jgi:hypothetical protein